MQYYLLNREFEIIEGIELFTSMIWTERYYEAGDFELYLPANKYSMDLYTKAAKEHYYIVRSDDYTSESYSSMRCMIVENVKLDESLKDDAHLIITGRSLKSLLNRRVVAGVKNVGGELETEIRSIVEENAIRPRLTERLIPDLIFGKEAGITDLINAQLKGAYVDDAITSLCKLKKVGWDIRLNLKNKRMEFFLYRGTDRSYAQTEEEASKLNSYVVFSQDFDNLMGSTYNLETRDYRNVAYVYSEYLEEDPDTKKEFTKEYEQYVPSKKIEYNPYQLDRFEYFVDASNISTRGATEFKIRDHLNELRTSMIAKGQTEIDKLLYTTEMLGDVVPDLTFIVNRDYFLGDLVTIKNQYDLRMESRVTELTETWDSTRHICMPVFTVENFTGKNEEEDLSTTNAVVRLTEGDDPSVLLTSDGEAERISLGWLYDALVAINPDGTVEDRILEDSNEVLLCTDIEATDKNQEVD